MTEIKTEKGGKVFVSDEILTTIAGRAAVEAEGVVGLGYFGTVPANKAIRKRLPKGVGVAVLDQNVKLALAVNVKMGVKIHEVSKDVQERVKTAVETMTGLNVLEVNIRISAVLPQKA